MNYALPLLNHWLGKLLYKKNHSIPRPNTLKEASQPQPNNHNQMYFVAHCDRGLNRFYIEHYTHGLHSEQFVMLTTSSRNSFMKPPSFSTIRETPGRYHTIRRIYPSISIPSFCSLNSFTTNRFLLTCCTTSFALHGKFLIPTLQNYYPRWTDRQR